MFNLFKKKKNKEKDDISSNDDDLFTLMLSIDQKNENIFITTNIENKNLSVREVSNIANSLYHITHGDFNKQIIESLLLHMNNADHSDNVKNIINIWSNTEKLKTNKKYKINPRTIFEINGENKYE